MGLIRKHDQVGSGGTVSVGGGGQGKPGKSVEFTVDPINNRVGFRLQGETNYQYLDLPDVDNLQYLVDTANDRVGFKLESEATYTYLEIPQAELPNTFDFDSLTVQGSKTLTESSGGGVLTILPYQASHTILADEAYQEYYTEISGDAEFVLDVPNGSPDTYAPTVVVHVKNVVAGNAVTFRTPTNAYIGYYNAIPVYDDTNGRLTTFTFYRVKDIWVGSSAKVE